MKGHCSAMCSTRNHKTPRNGMLSIQMNQLLPRYKTVIIIYLFFHSRYIFRIPCFIQWESPVSFLWNRFYILGWDNRFLRAVDIIINAFSLHHNSLSLSLYYKMSAGGIYVNATLRPVFLSLMAWWHMEGPGLPGTEPRYEIQWLYICCYLLPAPHGGHTK